MASIAEDMQVEQGDVANEALVGPFPNRETYAVHLRHMNFGFLGKEVREMGRALVPREEGGSGGDGSDASAFCDCTWRAERGMVMERLRGGACAVIARPATRLRVARSDGGV